MDTVELCCAVCDAATESFELRELLGGGVKVCPECSRALDEQHPTSLEEARAMFAGPGPDAFLQATAEEELVARYAVLRLRREEGRGDDAALALVRGLLVEQIVGRLEATGRVGELYACWLRSDLDLLAELCTVATDAKVTVPGEFAAAFESEQSRLKAKMEQLLRDGLDERSACAVLCAIEELRAGRAASFSECDLDENLRRIVERYAARDAIPAHFRE